jgi:hypothetical protein
MPHDLRHIAHDKHALPLVIGLATERGGILNWPDP